MDGTKVLGGPAANDANRFKIRDKIWCERGCIGTCNLSVAGGTSPAVHGSVVHDGTRPLLRCGNADGLEGGRKRYEERLIAVNVVAVSELSGGSISPAKHVAGVGDGAGVLFASGYCGEEHGRIARVG